LVWLNDEVVNNYMMLLKQRAAELSASNAEEHPKCYFQSSFFYNKLSDENTGYNYSSVARWTRRGAGKVDVFAMDMVFFPINVSNVSRMLAMRWRCDAGAYSEHIAKRQIWAVYLYIYDYYVCI
jgi:Ulp1 family protease